MSEVKVKLIEGGGVYVVETKAPRGAELQSHRHSHDHVSVLVHGAARLTINGQVEYLQGYHSLVIPAGVDHRVVAITDITWLCVWKADQAPRAEMDDFVRTIGGCADCPGGCEPTDELSFGRTPIKTEDAR